MVAWIFTSRHSPGDQHLDQDAEGWQEPLRPLAVVTLHPTPASRPSLTTHASHVCSSLHIRGFMSGLGVWLLVLLTGVRFRRFSHMDTCSRGLFISATERHSGR